jgi:hypothetical protein
MQQLGLQRVGQLLRAREVADVGEGVVGRREVDAFS